MQGFNQRYKKHVTFLSQINFLEAQWTHCRDWWQMVDLIANFLFNFKPFGDFYYSTVSILLTTACQYGLPQPANTAYHSLPILLLRANSVIKCLGNTLFKFSISSCFTKHLGQIYKWPISFLNVIFHWHQFRASFHRPC